MNQIQTQVEPDYVVTFIGMTSWKALFPMALSQLFIRTRDGDHPKGREAVMTVPAEYYGHLLYWAAKKGFLSGSVYNGIMPDSITLFGYHILPIGESPKDRYDGPKSYDEDDELTSSSYQTHEVRCFYGEKASQIREQKKS